MPGAAEVIAAKVLIVDDQEADARLVKSILEASGYASLVATSDPRAAVELFRRERHDLVILDLLMPGLDGFGVMERLREIEPEGCLPVLAVTSDPDMMMRALAAGARDFLSKPLKRAELLARSRNLLEERLLMKALRDNSRSLEQVLDERTANLRESEALFRLFAANLPEGIWIRGVEDRTYRYVNPAMQRIIGRKLLAGEAIDKGMGAMMPEDREAIRGDMERAPWGGVDREVRFMHEDGSLRWTHLRTFPMTDLQANRSWVAGIIEDVTERKAAETALVQSESRFRALVEQSLVGIYIRTEDRIVYANPRLSELIGYGMDEMTTLDFRDVVVAEDYPRIQEMLRKRHAGEAGSLSAECRLRRKDDRVVHVRVESKVIEVDGRKAVLGIVEDITTAQLAQAELETANEQLRQLSNRLLALQEQERRTISRELHDDVGQSMLALKIGLHRLQEHIGKKPAAMLDECIRIAESVQEVLHELSVELMPPHLEHLGLRDALSWLANRQQRLTGVAIHCRLGGFDGDRLAAELETTCFRICQEAVNNATRHADARKITIELGVESDWLVLHVRDDGKGFDLASRREAALAKGSLGLFSMEERARLAGGSLEVNACPGAGTTVSARFSLRARALEAKP